MDNEYFFEPLDPLEISFSKDKCNFSGTPKPSPSAKDKENVLPDTDSSLRYIEIRHHSLSKASPPTVRNNQLFVPPCLASTDQKYSFCEPVNRRLELPSGSPRRSKAHCSTIRKRQPSTTTPSSTPHPVQPIRHTLDHTRSSHEK